MDINDNILITGGAGYIGSHTRKKYKLLILALVWVIRRYWLEVLRKQKDCCHGNRDTLHWKQSLRLRGNGIQENNSML